MPRPNRAKRAILNSVARSGRRSSLFWWLVDHHDEILKASESSRIDWASFCREAAANGLTDTRGQPPTERNARETWLQARKVVARARQAAEKTPPRFLPSRLPKDWQPEVVQPSAPARPASARPPAAPAPPPLPVPPLTPLVTTRSYGPKHIPDEELDLSLAPETYENEKGEIVPMPLEARQRFARMKMQLRAETEERFRFGGW